MSSEIERRLTVILWGMKTTDPALMAEELRKHGVTIEQTALDGPPPDESVEARLSRIEHILRAGPDIYGPDIWSCLEADAKRIAALESHLKVVTRERLGFHW